MHSRFFLFWRLLICFLFMSSLLSPLVSTATAAPSSFSATVLDSDHASPVSRPMSAYSPEVAMPHDTIGWGNLQWPFTIEHSIGLTPTESIYGQAWIDGVTSNPGPTPGLTAQVGYGPEDQAPTNWTEWTEASFNVQAGNNDEFMASLVPEATGSFNYLYRYSTDSGVNWVYADQSGIIDGQAIPPAPGKLTVLSSDDITPPDFVGYLHISDQGPDHLTLEWEPVTGTDVYAYDIFRFQDWSETPQRVGRVLHPSTTFTDLTVTSGQSYYYQVMTLDTSFNASPYSSNTWGTAEIKMVNVTFTVYAPYHTPENDTIYITGNFPGWPAWDPDEMPMHKVQPRVWMYEASLPEGASGEYKYTRGSWDTVEWWGSINDTGNRHLTVDAGSEFYLMVEDTDRAHWDDPAVPDDHKAIRDWRDPMVATTQPEDGWYGVPVNTPITVTWNSTMTTGTTFSVAGPDGPVNGSFSYPSEPPQVVVFTPEADLPTGPFTMTAHAQQNLSGITQQQDFVMSASTDLPTITVVKPQYDYVELDPMFPNFEVLVTLNGPSYLPVSVDYETLSGTATADSDFTYVSGTLIFAPGETYKWISIPILDDAEDESLETFELVLSNPISVYLGDPSQVTLELQDNDGPSAQVSFESTSYQVDEGAGSALLTLIITPTEGWDGYVAFDLISGTANPEIDYADPLAPGVPYVVDIQAGETTKTIAVEIFEDDLDELPETFQVVLDGIPNGSVVSPSTATVTILDNDEPQPPTVQFAAESYEATEESETAVLTVTLSVAAEDPVTVHYASANGTAAAGSDYTVVSETLTFDPGETTKTLQVPLLDDQADEQSETLTVTLSGPNGAVLGEQDAATITILDDDAPGGDDDPPEYNIFTALIYKK